MPSLTPPLFDLDDTVIRTPKRGALRAAQVWDARGHWLVGLFPDRRSARAAAKQFLADRSLFPGAVRHKRRCRGHEPRYKWVRKVKGINTWQSRPWLGEGRGSLNLGLFTFEDHGERAEWAAAQVSKAFMRLWRPGVSVGQAVELLKREPKNKDRCRPDLEVPMSVRDMLPPRNFGPTEDAEERAERLRDEADERERGRYCGGLLFAA